MMNENTESLLNKIRRLYTKIFLVSLHNRIHSYNASGVSNTHYDISGALHKLIDETVKEVSRNYSVKDYRNVKTQVIVNSLNLGTSDNSQSGPIKMGAMTRNALSLYLINQQAQENNSHMSEKLQRSIWDHVHSVHRFALLGDGNTAKLHADIACNAMKTLSCYMQDDEYSEFFSEINCQITIDNRPENK